jgi:hypothetical protein
MEAAEHAAILELRDYEAAIDEVADHHLAVAQRIWPDGTMLHCTRCGRVQQATTAQVARYMAHGWPTCCLRETMHLGEGPSN